MANAYEVLGVDQNATLDEIRRAYREKARNLHPDRLIDEPPEVVKRSSEQFAEIAQAWEILRDTERRRAYDRGIRMESSLGDRSGTFDGTETGVEDILIGSVFEGARGVFRNVTQGTVGWDAALLVIGVCKESLDNQSSTSSIRSKYPDLSDRRLIDGLAVYSALCFAMDEIDRELLSGERGKNAFFQPMRDVYSIAYNAATSVSEKFIDSNFPSKFPRATSLLDRLYVINRRRLSLGDGTVTRDPRTAPCRLCGSGPTRSVSLREVQGRIFSTATRSLNEPLCSDCGRSLGRIMQANTLALGWWGIFAFIITPFYAVMNAWNLFELGRLDPTVATKWSTMPPLEPGVSVWKRKRSYVAAIVLAVAVFIIGGSAASSDGNSTGGGGSSTVDWKVGACLDFVGTRAAPTPCSGSYDGVVVAVEFTTVACPMSATRYVEHQGRVYCIR